MKAECGAFEVIIIVMLVKCSQTLTHQGRGGVRVALRNNDRLKVIDTRLVCVRR